MARNYCQCATALDGVMARVANDQSRYDQALAAFASISQDLSSIGPANPNLTADMTALLATDPTNVALQNLSASYAAACANLQTLYAQVQATIALLNPDQ